MPQMFLKVLVGNYCDITYITYIYIYDTSQELKERLTTPSIMEF